MSCLRLLMLLFSPLTLTQLGSTIEIPPLRRQLFKDFILSLNIRQYGTVLDGGVIEAYHHKIINNYIDDPTYHKFVIAFEKYVKPKLTLQFGDTCDPNYANEYKHAENDLITDLSLIHWVSQHVPDKKTGAVGIDATVQYCDFQRGLICNPSTSKCECPAEATLMDADNPSIHLDKYCFVRPYEKCFLLDLKNSELTEGLLLDRLTYLMFNPERPLSCATGTHCRFKEPFIKIPRCFCFDDSTHPDCSGKTLYWPLPLSSFVPPPTSANLHELFELIWVTTFGFENLYTTIGKDESVWANPSSVRTLNRLRLGLAEVLGIDQDSTAARIGYLLGVVPILKQSINENCWMDLNPAFECHHYRSGIQEKIHPFYWNMRKFCNCYVIRDSDYIVSGDFHQEIVEWRKFGSPCRIGVEDVGGMCAPGLVCYRWEKGAEEGSCHCPGGFGWLDGDNKCVSSENSAHLTSLVNFIQPNTVQIRGRELLEVQQRVRELERADRFTRDPGDYCSFRNELLWQDVYDWFLGLEFFSPSVALVNGASEFAIEDELQRFQEIQEDNKKLCDKKFGYACVQRPGATDPNIGICILKNPDNAIEKNPNLQKILKSVSDRKAYEAAAVKRLKENVDIDTREVVCSVFGTGSAGLVDTNGKCNGENFCVEDYSPPDVLETVWRITDVSSGNVIDDHFGTQNGEVPVPKPNEEAVMIGCEMGSSPVKTVCQCINTKFTSLVPNYLDNTTGVRARALSSSGNPLSRCGSPPPDQYKLCEKYVLTKRVDILKRAVISGSVLLGGAKCHHKAENYIKNSIRSLDGSAPEDLYQVVGNLRKALSLTKKFCDRRRLLRCDATKGECVCQKNTLFRKVADGTLTEHCYIYKGPCVQDVTRYMPLFPHEKSYVLMHYGDIISVDEVNVNGCLPNICLMAKEKQCIIDDTYTVLITQASPSTNNNNNNNRPGFTPTTNNGKGKGNNKDDFYYYYEDDFQVLSGAGRKYNNIWQLVAASWLYLIGNLVI